MNPVCVTRGITRFSRLNKRIYVYNVNNCTNTLPTIHQYYRELHIHSSLFARIPFILSDIGEGIREVVVKEWYVKVGDNVKQFDNICEVQSDKASVTITSRYDGTISKLYYDIDQTALVGKPLIDVETDDTTSSEVSNPLDEDIVPASQTITKASDEISNQVVDENATPTPQKYAEATDLPRAAFSSSNDTQCVPSVRRLAKEHKIELTKVKGTGKNGRILKEDVLNYIQQPGLATVTYDKRREKLTGFQKTMVKTMTESSKIPQFLYSDEIIITELSNLRKLLRDENALRISFIPFFVKAISNGLLKYPILNASLDEQCEHIIFHKTHNIGIAMDTTQGLAVPVIKNVESKGIMDISMELQRLLKSGKEGTFSPNDLSGGTFTVSNIGSIGGTYTKPLLLPPQVAIVAIGASQVVPKFDEAKNIIPQEVLNISASGDHRIIDGATMARFVAMVKRQLESPHLLFLNI